MRSCCQGQYLGQPILISSSAFQRLNPLWRGKELATAIAKIHSVTKCLQIVHFFFLYSAMLQATAAVPFPSATDSPPSAIFTAADVLFRCLFHIVPLRNQNTAVLRGLVVAGVQQLRRAFFAELHGAI